MPVKCFRMGIIFTYMFMQTSDLESKLAATQGCRLRLIVTDGVFSMDGNVAPLKLDCRDKLTHILVDVINNKELLFQGYKRPCSKIQCINFH